MASGTKFYIYAGGRWREVDLRDGRIESWGRAKFVYPRRGKIHVPKTRAVLSALRDLSAGQNSAVKDGAHLPYKKNETIKKNERKNEGTCECSHRCHHSNSNNNGCVPSRTKQTPKMDAGIQCIPKADAGIQTSLPSQTLSFPDSLNKQNSRKRRRESTSSDENAPTKMALVDTNTSKNPPRIVLSKKRSTANRSEKNVSVPEKKIPILKLNKADTAKYNIYQRKRSDSTDSIVWVVLPKNEDTNEKLNSNEITEYLKIDSNKKKSDNNPSFHSRPKIQSQSNIKSSKEQKNRKSRSNFEKQKTMQRSESNSDTPSNPPTKSNVDVAIDTRKDQCKELIIDEADIEILRNYLVTNASDFDLLKFDQDDEYKKHFFFKINPLVNVERCPKIASMLQSKSQDDASLKEFVFHLGLKSVSEISVPQRYRMRKLKETRRYLDRDSSESETDKENSKKNLRNKDRKGNDKLEKHKNIKSKTYNSYSSESHTSTDNEEEYKNNDKSRKRSERLLNKSLMDSSKTSRSTRYEKRKSKNSQRSQLKELFSSKGYDKMRNSGDDSNDSEVPGTSKEVNRKDQIKVNNRKNLNLYHSSNNDSDVDAIKPSNEMNKKGQYIKDYNNIDLTSASDENSDKGGKKTDKTSQIKRKNDKRNISLTNEKTINVNDAESSKESKRRNKTKIINEKINSITRIGRKDSMDHSSGEEFTKLSKESKRRVQEKANDTKFNGNKTKNNDLTDSNEEASDAKIPKPSKKKNQKTRADKTNNIDHKASNEEISDEEINKSSKEPIRKVQNKENNNNKGRNMNDENSDHESLKELGRVQKNNDKTNSRIKIDHNEENSEVPKLRSNINDQSKANTTKNTTTSTLELSSDNERRVFVKKNGQQSSSGLRQYSNLEDHAIVTWVSVGGRASCVNGNRIWKELQDQFQNIAGQTRSWHSLRNRYLRKILPELGQYALPRSQETRLRAAAATGELKSRKGVPRRNSIFGVPTRGALSRLRGRSRSLSSETEPPAKRHKHDHTRRETSPSRKRALRSSLPPSPDKSRRSLRYSEITRHFADKHRQDNSTPSASPKSATKNTTTEKSVTEERKESSAKSLRRSFRTNALPQETENNEKEGSRSRRLFNHNVAL